MLRSNLRTFGVFKKKVLHLNDMQDIISEKHLLGHSRPRGLSCAKSPKPALSKHAEEDAINRLGWHMRGRNRNLRQLHLLVVRFYHDGQAANSKPCVMCVQRLIQTASKYNIAHDQFKISYSMNNGLVHTTTLSVLKNETLHVTSGTKKCFRK